MADIYIPNAANWINALEAGREGAMTRRKQQAQAAAGQRLMTGDYSGAAEQLMPFDMGTGLKLQEYGEKKQERGRKRETLRRFQEDPDAALAEALEIDPDFYKELKDVADETRLKKAQQWGGVLRSIGLEPEDQWDDLVAANRAQLIALDIPEQEIDAFIQADPQSRRVMMSTMLSRAEMLDKYLAQRNSDREFTATQADRQRDDARADRQLGISEEQLRLSRQREARIASGDGEWEEF